MKVVIFFCMIMLGNIGSISAHGDEHKKNPVKVDTITIAGKDTLTINGKPFNHKTNNHSNNEEKTVERFELKPFQQIFEHLHNKTVHFPIAIGIVAFIFTIINFKQKSFDKTIVILVLIGFGFSIIALFTGLSQAKPFANTNKEWLVTIHRNLGIGILIDYILWLIIITKQKTKKYSWLPGLILFILLIFAGFIGGIIAH